MKFLLIVLCFIPACSLFHTVPDSVKEAATYAFKIAVFNDANLKIINQQYERAWLEFMIKHGATKEEMKQLAILRDEIARRTEPLGRYGVELTLAVSEYLNTDGASLEKLVQTLSLIKERI